MLTVSHSISNTLISSFFWISELGEILFSSIVNEVIRTISSLFFLQKDFERKKSTRTQK